MLVWRICREAYAHTPFSGDGGLKAAMRWNHKGHRIIYTSQSLSLATLELWVHVDPAEPLVSYVAVPATVPDQIPIYVFEESELPKTWRDDPVPPELRDLGTAWLTSGSTAIARVPSVVVPGEYNFLFNPEHQEFSRVLIGNRIPFVFDRRMWKKSFV